jgi:CDGSH-type Zn-finger protein
MSSTKTQISVTVSKDGPYIVSGDPRLTEQVIVTNAKGDSLQWREGEVYEAPAKCALCRCGHSHKAPFCDGTHAKVGFDGTETAPRTPYSEKVTVFDGPVLALLDARHLCAGGRFCDPNGKVWNQVARCSTVGPPKLQMKDDAPSFFLGLIAGMISAQPSGSFPAVRQ